MTVHQAATGLALWGVPWRLAVVIAVCAAAVPLPDGASASNPHLAAQTSARQNTSAEQPMMMCNIVGVGERSMHKNTVWPSMA